MACKVNTALDVSMPMRSDVRFQGVWTHFPNRRLSARRCARKMKSCKAGGGPVGRRLTCSDARVGYRLSDYRPGLVPVLSRASAHSSPPAVHDSLWAFLSSSLTSQLLPCPTPPPSAADAVPPAEQWPRGKPQFHAQWRRQRRCSVCPSPSSGDTAHTVASVPSRRYRAPTPADPAAVVDDRPRDQR